MSKTQGINKCSVEKYTPRNTTISLNPWKIVFSLLVIQHSMWLLQSNIQTVKGKAVPLQAWSGPEGSRKLR
jgi:hypothetical protein